MVAKITHSVSLLRTLSYNEKKVQTGLAGCIGEGNFLLPVNKMDFAHKRERFERRNSLNQRATVKTLHVSLNFSPSEKLSIEKLLAIGAEYMDRIGFGEQPYLIYQHKDAGHPHIHIVSTLIRKDGTRINTHNIERNQSEKACKQIEEKFQLVKGGQQKQLGNNKIRPSVPYPVLYGKSETKRGITDVLNVVVNLYNYTSLPEFNAILKQYNVVADRGRENSFMYQKKGLLYRVLDPHGNKIGVPIKASTIDGRPILARLEDHFEKNQQAREHLKIKLAYAIEQALMLSPKNITEFSDILTSKNIHTVLQQRAEGHISDITFIDNTNKSAFNGAHIDNTYSIEGLSKKMNAEFGGPFNTEPIKIFDQSIKKYLNNQHAEYGKASVINDLIHPVQASEPIAQQFKKRKRVMKKIIAI